MNAWTASSCMNGGGGGVREEYCTVPAAEHRVSPKTNPLYYCLIRSRCTENFIQLNWNVASKSSSYNTLFCKNHKLAGNCFSSSKMSFITDTSVIFNSAYLQEYFLVSNKLNHWARGRILFLTSAIFYLTSSNVWIAGVRNQHYQYFITFWVKNALLVFHTVTHSHIILDESHCKRINIAARQELATSSTVGNNTITNENVFFPRVHLHLEYEVQENICVIQLKKFLT